VATAYAVVVGYAIDERKPIRVGGLRGASHVKQCQKQGRNKGVSLVFEYPEISGKKFEKHH